MILSLETRSLTEPSGALALAGLKRYIMSNGLLNKGGRYVVVVSGANMNFDRLRFVAERAELGEGREALISVDIPEVQGSFLALHSIIHPRQTTEFIYRYNVTESPERKGRRANILFSFKLGTATPASTSPADINRTLSPADRDAEIAALLEALRKEDMHGVDVSDNELAKSHGRYMIGGQPKEGQGVEHERIFRFGE